MGWVQTRLLFAILRATNCCMCGSRLKWSGVGMGDGTGLALVVNYIVIELQLCHCFTIKYSQRTPLQITSSLPFLLVLLGFINYEFIIVYYY